MKNILLLALLLLAAPLRAQDLSYAGFVSISTNPTACTGTKSWHYQCNPSAWVAFGAVLSTDVVAGCITITDISTCANTGTNRRWLGAAALTELSYLKICASPTLTATAGCPTGRTFFLQSEQPAPSPTEPPPVTPPPTTAMFSDVTASVVPTAYTVSMNFEAEFVDANKDGWLDMFIGAHDDNSVLSGAPSTLYVQNPTVSMDSPNRFVFVSASELGYTQAGMPRCASRYLFGNWYGDPNGLPSILCHDIDGSGAAKYEVLGLDTAGLPLFADKAVGCGSTALPKMFCLPISVSVDGTITMATRNRSAANPNVGVIRDTSMVAVSVPSPLLLQANAMIVTNVAGNAMPELVVPALDGYLQLIGGSYVWQSDKFDGALPPVLAGDSHMVPFDFDADGDQDLFLGYAPYSCETCDSVQGVYKGPEVFTPLVYRNDGGSFIDITATSGLVGALKARYYHTFYGNTVATHVDNDKYPDLILGAECQGHGATCSWVAIIKNAGDSTFTVDHGTNFKGFSQTGEANGGGRPAIAVGDFDKDCRADLIKTQGRIDANHNSLGLHRNIVTNDSRCITLSASGAGDNTDGLGTYIIIRNPADGSVVGSDSIGVPNANTTNLMPLFGVGTLTVVDIEVERANYLGNCYFEDVPTNARYHITNTCDLVAE